jgi:lipopolysaccharide transport system ATP-binding protein
MASAVVVTGLSKQFRRYHPHRPLTIQEALARGLGQLRSVERFWGLRDVSFEVSKGQTLGIIGANGSGKSTLLRLIGGVGRADAGHVDVFGRLGALLDLSAGFHPDLTGRENAIMAGILSGLRRRQVTDRLAYIITFSELEPCIDNPIRTYSSGMQMRLAFAAAMYSDPEILLIDEVLAVGDLAFQRKCRERMEQFKAEGCTILVVSHDLETIAELCDTALWLDAGRVVAHGPTADIIHGYVTYMGGGKDMAVSGGAPISIAGRAR